MNKSASSPALLAAGSEVTTHIPKRATQHGIFLPAYEVTPVDLKPGQKSAIRQLYSEEAKTIEETYMETDLPKGSTYNRLMESRFLPRDFAHPRASMKPGNAPMESLGHQGTAHWKSEYKACTDVKSIDGAKYQRQFGPSYRVSNPPTCVSGGEILSTYAQEFGKYGSDPRHKLPPTMQKLPTFKTQLTIGTTKGTEHMPGYQGFLATNTANPKVAQVVNGSELRSTDKSNLTHVFHTNLVGYAGHKATNACNDRGGVRPSVHTTMGRDFLHPPASSYQG